MKRKYAPGMLVIALLVIGTTIAQASSKVEQPKIGNPNVQAVVLAKQELSEEVEQHADKLGVHVRRQAHNDQQIAVLQQVLDRFVNAAGSSSIVGASFGLATVDNYGPGDEADGKIDLIINNRLVWALHIAGVITQHYGPVGTSSTSKETDYIAIYDAISGEFLSATSVS
jgi:hypothetical protein